MLILQTGTTDFRNTVQLMLQVGVKMEKLNPVGNGHLELSIIIPRTIVAFVASQVAVSIYLDNL